MSDSKKQWQTAIGHPTDEQIYVRGYRVTDLMGHVSFPALVHLEFKGELPSPGAERMIDALLVAVVEHGISPSSTVSRFLYASGVPLQAAMAGGALTFGDIHGGAGQEFARVIQQAVAEAAAQEVSIEDHATHVVQQARATRQPLPGFGHPQHPQGDPRAPVLFALSEETGTAGRHVRMARALEQALATSVGRRIPLNIDGAMGAILSDLGFDWRLARAFIVAPRMIGLAAHAVEEMDRHGGWRHIPLDDVSYDGPMDRELDA